MLHTKLIPNYQLNFHPTVPTTLLSGSTDGLVNVYDTRVTDEDDVVAAAFNHGSVHKAGFLPAIPPGREASELYALSHDEKLAVYDAGGAAEQGAAAADFGDVRGALGCRYVADVVTRRDSDGGAVVGSGDQEFVSLHTPLFSPYFYRLPNHSKEEEMDPIHCV